MNVVRVSTLEAFRRWRNDEDSSVDDLFHVPETEAMRVGTALHKVLELSSAGTFDKVCSDGYTFRFDCDIEIPAMQVKEFRSNKRYGDLTVSGQCDGIIGRTVYDYKTTGFFSTDKYLDGYQWRYYLDIFGLDVFRWLVFVIEPDRQDSCLYSVREFHQLEALRYSGLHTDCMALAKDFQDFLSRANGTKGQNND